MAKDFAFLYKGPKVQFYKRNQDQNYDGSKVILFYYNHHIPSVDVGSPCPQYRV